MKQMKTSFVEVVFAAQPPIAFVETEPVSVASAGFVEFVVESDFLS